MIRMDSGGVIWLSSSSAAVVVEQVGRVVDAGFAGNQRRQQDDRANHHKLHDYEGNGALADVAGPELAVRDAAQVEQGESERRMHLSSSASMPLASLSKGV